MAPRPPKTSPDRIAAALADAARVQIMHRLLEGPASVSELVTVAGASQSGVSNHLKVLRDCGLVHASRVQRSVVCELAGPEVANLVESLLAVGGRPGRDRPGDTTLAWARTCYDHLAGTLGVWLYDRLVQSEALTPDATGRGDMGLSDGGRRLLSGLGVDVVSAMKSRRRFAYACLDWTERRPHLGGSLGAQICGTMLSRGWLVRLAGTRAVRITSTGEGALAALGDLPGRARHFG